jgi:ribonucleotide monophosphatase NagD (HAD superfamily)
VLVMTGVTSYRDLEEPRGQLAATPTHIMDALADLREAL